MIITIDTTTPLSAQDLAVLGGLLGANTSSVVIQEPAPAAAHVKKPVKTPVEVSEAPTPAAGTPTPTEEEEASEEPQGDEDFTIDDAVSKATELVGTGKTALVKAALVKIGAKRVSELKGDKIAAFMKELS